MQLKTPSGQVLTYCILQMFPFTSESKRMGIIVRVCHGYGYTHTPVVSQVPGFLRKYRNCPAPHIGGAGQYYKAVTHEQATE